MVKCSIVVFCIAIVVAFTGKLKGKTTGNQTALTANPSTRPTNLIIIPVNAFNFKLKLFLIDIEIKKLGFKFLTIPCL